MRMTILATAAAGVLAVGAGEAQQTRTPTERPAHNVYVLEGCLTAGREGSDQYVLTDAKPKNGPAPPAAPPAEGAASGTEFLLRGVSEVAGGGVSDEELAQHVGYLVEVAVRPPERAPEPERTTSGVVTEGSTGLPKVAAEQAPVISTVSSITRRGGACS
jgi:hypothetical protein